jgi:serine/threonine-protein kinase
VDEAERHRGDAGEPEWAERDSETRGAVRFGPYRLGPLLGEGGMGSVHLAWDTSLGRRVALKIVRGESPELVQRMFQEAQLQARVEHPAVCRIYQVGEDGGHPFIAMQFIQGANFSEWAPHLGVESKLRLMVQVADAVHAAHRVGLIHRDLKPANMLVEQDEAGTLRPYVLDFGLARDLAGAGITQQGIAVGSPSYMAPEQASGGRVDERTDVYGLGATLYELLGGRPPFRGASVLETVRQVMETDAPMLRSLDAELPADIESVVHKCIEKDPRARYASARELRDDLQRFLDGEPVEARKQSPLRRLWSRVKRNRALSLVVSSALALVLIFAVFAFWTWRNGQEQARWAQRFGQQVREMDATLRNAHLFPLHDMRPERSEVRLRLDRIREQLKGLGNASQGPGNLALGQGHLMLGEPEAARRALQEAWEAGYRTPEVALAQVEALGELQRREGDAAFLVSRPTLREAVRAQVNRSYREAIAARLPLARQGAGLTPQQEAMIARLGGRPAEAERLAREAFDRQRWNYEARLEEIAAIFQQAREAPRDQDRRLASRLAEAESLLAWLKETARSDPRVHLAEGQDRLLRIRLDLPGRPLDQCLREGLMAIDRALLTDPGNGEPQILRAELYYWMALRQGALPVQAAYWVDRALEACAKAASDPTTRSRAWAYQGSLVLHRAETLQEAGRDPSSAVAEGTTLWKRALQSGLESPSQQLRGALELAFAQLQLADFALGHGKDPLPALGAAQEAYRHVLQLEPGNGDAALELALVQRRLGDDAARKGAASESHYREARKNLDAFLQGHPDSDQGWNYLGTVAQSQAEAALSRGEDPGPFLDSAVVAFRRAARLQPRNPGYALNLHEALRHLAEASLAAGQDPEPRIQAALSVLNEAGSLSGSGPSSWEFHLGRALLFRLRAEAESAAGRDPAASLREGEKAARESTFKGFRQAETWEGLGDLLLARERTVFPRLSPRGPAEARRAYTRSTQINPADPAPWVGLGRVDLLEAAWRIRELRDPSGFLDAAEGRVRKALALNPRHAEAVALQSACALARGAAASGDPRNLRLQQAAEYAGAALALNPREETALRVQAAAKGLKFPKVGRPDPALDSILSALAQPR